MVWYINYPIEYGSEAWNFTISDNNNDSLETIYHKVCKLTLDLSPNLRVYSELGCTPLNMQKSSNGKIMAQIKWKWGFRRSLFTC